MRAILCGRLLRPSRCYLAVIHGDIARQVSARTRSLFMGMRPLSNRRKGASCGGCTFSWLERAIYGGVGCLEAVLVPTIDRGAALVLDDLVRISPCRMPTLVMANVDSWMAGFGQATHQFQLNRVYTGMDEAMHCWQRAVCIKQLSVLRVAYGNSCILFVIRAPYSILHRKFGSLVPVLQAGSEGRSGMRAPVIGSLRLAVSGVVWV